VATIRLLNSAFALPAGAAPGADAVPLDMVRESARIVSPSIAVFPHPPKGTPSIQRGRQIDKRFVAKRKASAQQGRNS
jgi:hypothetical protein